MNERTNKPTNNWRKIELTNTQNQETENVQWTKERTNKQTNEQTKNRTDKWTNTPTNRQNNEETLPVLSCCWQKVYLGLLKKALIKYCNEKLQ